MDSWVRWGAASSSFAQETASEGLCLTYRPSKRGSTFTPASKREDAKSRPIGDGFAPRDCKRVSGPHTPPPGTPTPIHGIRHLDERLERLAFPTEEVIAEGRAPLETCTITTSEHGDIYRATDAYVSWLRSRIPGYGGSDRVVRASSGGQASSDGGGKSAWLNGRMKRELDVGV